MGLLEELKKDSEGDTFREKALSSQRLQHERIVGNQFLCSIFSILTGKGLNLEVRSTGRDYDVKTFAYSKYKGNIEGSKLYIVQGVNSNDVLNMWFYDIPDSYSDAKYQKIEVSVNVRPIDLVKQFLRRPILTYTLDFESLTLGNTFITLDGIVDKFNVIYRKGVGDEVSYQKSFIQISEFLKQEHSSEMIDDNSSGYQVKMTPEEVLKYIEIIL